MNITLSEDGNEFTNEARLIKEALRGRAVYYERKAEEHAATGATLAASKYLQRAFTVRRVLKREFGDES